MPPQSEWPELLEEQAYLVQMLSEMAHDSGALDSTRTLLDTLRADLRLCTIQVADLERESRDSSPKPPDAKVTSSASRFIHRVTASIGSDKDKEKLKEKEKEKENYVLGEDERLLAVWIKKRTLAVEVKNLEVRARILQRRNRHYAELQRRLAAVYARIPLGKGSPSREEEDAEEETHRARLTLHEVQRIHARYKALVALLQQGDYALINAGHHLSAADAKVGLAIDAAKRCAVQTAVVVDQAKRIDPSFFDQEETEVLKAGWLAEVFRTTAPDDQYCTLLIQALKPYHTALLSLISRANKRANEHDNATRRAALRCSDVTARRDTLKRRVLVACATAEASTTGDMSLVDPGPEKDGLARMRDITAGLEGLIPAVVSPGGSVIAAAGSSDVAEERPRVGLEKPIPRLPPLASPQPRSPPQTHLLSSTFIQDLASASSSSTISGIDPPPDAQFGSVEKRVRRGSPAVRQTPDPNPPPPTYPNDSRRISSDSTPRQSASSLYDSTMRAQQHASPRQSRESPPGPSPLYQSEFAPARSRLSRELPPPLGGSNSEFAPARTASGARDDSGGGVPPAQTTPRQAQPVMYQDVLPLVVPKKSNQPDGKTASNRTSDPRYQPPTSSRPATADAYQARPRSSPQSQSSSRPQQAQVGAREDVAVVPQAQTTSRQAQPMVYKDVPPTFVAPKQSDVKTAAQGSVSNRSSDPRYQQLPAATTDPSYQARPRSSPQPQSSRQQQSAQVGLVQGTRESYPDARPSKVGGVSSSSSGSSSDPSTQAASDIPSASERPPVRGILKPPAATAPRRPAAAVGIDTDPWGVRVAAASSSRPQPKIKAMFNLWRSAEGFKQEELGGPARAPLPLQQLTPELQPRPPSPVKRDNPRAAMQNLRFAEGVKIIPRPAVDSDPYEDEDEDEDDDALPPSPRRGSVLWLQDPEERVAESDEDVGRQPTSTRQQPTATARPANANRSESSISSSSSAYSASSRQSTETEMVISPSSIMATPPSSAISDSSLISYYTMRNDERAPHPSQSRQMSYGSVQSDHELVQSIFPSPAQSNISERDLLFGP